MALWIVRIFVIIVIVGPVAVLGITIYFTWPPKPWVWILLVMCVLMELDQRTITIFRNLWSRSRLR